MTTPTDSNPTTITPFSLKKTYQAPLIEGVLEAEIPSKEKIQSRYIVGPKNTLPENTTLQPVPLPIPGEPNAAYKAAIVLVAEIDRRLERGEHCRLNGKLCTTLDQAVNVLLDQIKTT